MISWIPSLTFYREQCNLYAYTNGNWNHFNKLTRLNTPISPTTHFSLWIILIPLSWLFFFEMIWFDTNFIFYYFFFTFNLLTISYRPNIVRFTSVDSMILLIFLDNSFALSVQFHFDFVHTMFYFVLFFRFKLPLKVSIEFSLLVSLIIVSVFWRQPNLFKIFIHWHGVIVCMYVYLCLFA